MTLERHRTNRTRRRRWLATLAALTALFALRPTIAAAGDVDLSNRVSVSMEYDDNVYKAGRDLVADELGRLFYDFGLGWRMTPNNLLQTSYQLGGKLYFHEDAEDTAINQLGLGYVNYSVPTYEFGATVGAKLRNVRDAQEDYFKYVARVFAGKRFIDAIYAGLHAEYSEFNFRGTEEFDYWTQLYGAEARYDYGRTFSAGLTYDFERKTYPYNSFQNIGTSDVILTQTNDTRTDDLQEFGASLRYQTTFLDALPFLGTFNYLLQLNRSNS
jgi:hypothetical protein